MSYKYGELRWQPVEVTTLGELEDNELYAFKTTDFRTYNFAFATMKVTNRGGKIGGCIVRFHDHDFQEKQETCTKMEFPAESAIVYLTLDKVEEYRDVFTVLEELEVEVFIEICVGLYEASQTLLKRPQYAYYSDAFINVQHEDTLELNYSALLT